MIIFQLLVIAFVSYALGSVNLSIILSKALKKQDIRELGSKNAGTTNTLRVLGKGPALLVLIWDVLKGVIAVLIARAIANAGKGVYPEDFVNVWCYGTMIASIAVILGHNFPVYFGFKGGKGVATSLGVILAIEWKIGISCLVLGVSMIAFTQMVSVGSLLAAVLYPILVFIMGGTFDTNFSVAPIKYVYRAFAILLAASVIIRHKENIKRILNGTENKLSFKKKVDDENSREEADKNEASKEEE